MSDDDDRISGIAASNRGGYPDDWNNQGQVAAWQTAEGFKALESSMNQPSPSTDYNNSVDYSSTSASPSNSYSSSYASTSPRRDCVSNDDKWAPSEVVSALAFLLGGYAGYTTGVTNHWSTLEVWLAAGGGAVGAAFVWVFVIEVIKGAVKNPAAKNGKKGLGSASSSSGSSSRGSASIDDKLTLSDVAISLVFFLGGIAGYIIGVTNDWSTLNVWLAAGGSAVGASVVCSLVIDGIKSLIAEIRQST